MDEARFRELVEFVKAEATVEEARVERDLYFATKDPDLLVDLIHWSEDHSVSWDAVALIAADSLAMGLALPEGLQEWAADVLGDQLKDNNHQRRPRPPAKGRRSEFIRDRRVWMAVYKLQSELKATRNVIRKDRIDKCCAKGGSACDVAGVAIMGPNTQYKTVESIWLRKSPSFRIGEDGAFRLYDPLRLPHDVRNSLLFPSAPKKGR